MRPGGGLRVLAVAWFGLAVLTTVWPGLAALWQGTGWALLALAAADAVVVWLLKPVKVAQRMPAHLPVSVAREVTVTLTNPTRARLRVEFLQPGRRDIRVSSLPGQMTLAPAAQTQVRYALCALQTGEVSLDRPILRVASPLRLWLRQVTAGEASTVRCFPDFPALDRYAEFTRRNQLGLLGVRQAGSRTEPDAHSLQVMVLLECGGQMLASEQAIPHFVHSLNAVLLLAHVATQNRDSFGFMTLGAGNVYVPPRRGAQTINSLLQLMHGLQPSVQDGDYRTAAAELAGRLTKHALVVMVTHLDGEEGHTLLPALRLLRQRHRLLFACLRGQALDAALRAPVRTFDQALHLAAIHQHLRERHRSLARIRALGVVTLDVPPARLPMMLVNRYLAIRRNGR